jgi:hypothetical protein
MNHQGNLMSLKSLARGSLAASSHLVRRVDFMNTDMQYHLSKGVSGSTGRPTIEARRVS